jgi:hypothetical protein
VVATTPPERADSGSTSKDAGHDARREASTGALSNACPTSRPAAGAPCALAAFTDCEFGSDPELHCDTLMGCADGGWVVTSSPEDAGCATNNSALCPATFSAITQEGLCTVDAGGLAGVECYYPEARCACTLSTAPATWLCDTAETPGCPDPRPRIGSPCEASDAAPLCDYGGCWPQTCQLGRWKLEYACGK